MITIRFKDIADILAEKRVCICIASNGLLLQELIGVYEGVLKGKSMK